MVFIEEFIFTYADYLKYCDNLQYPETEEEFICVAEDSVEYAFDEEEKVENKRKTGDKNTIKYLKTYYKIKRKWHNS